MDDRFRSFDKANCNKEHIEEIRNSGRILELNPEYVVEFKD